MDGYTQALDEPKRQAQERLADLLMRQNPVTRELLLWDVVGNLDHISVNY
jgi:hypothetical protein